MEIRRHYEETKRVARTQRRHEIIEGIAKPRNKTERKLNNAHDPARGSHADCEHDKTPKARAKCRAQRRSQLAEKSSSR